MSNNYDRKNATPCMGCMRILKWIPVLFIASIIVWSYYAYVIELCIFAIDNIFEKVIFLIFYHVIFVLFLWSYWNTIFTPVGTVPHTWRIPDVEIERLYRAEGQEQQKRILEGFAKDYPVCNRTLNGSIRFCDKCRIIKPDRAHHCSVCGICVLKMDHHCPWVNNCVNFNNYKFFVLFLGYALLYCLFVALTSLEYFIRFWRGELNEGMGRFHILFLFFVALMFAISLVSLFGYHIYLVLMNRTTLEAFRAPIFRIGGPNKNGFNLGKLANFQEVFGDNWQLWFLPIYSSKGDGQHYPMRIEQQQQPQREHHGHYSSQYRQQQFNPIYNSMDITKNVVHTSINSSAADQYSLELKSKNELMGMDENLTAQLLLQKEMTIPQQQRHKQQDSIEKTISKRTADTKIITATTTATTTTIVVATAATVVVSSPIPLSSSAMKMESVASLLPNNTVFIETQTQQQQQQKQQEKQSQLRNNLCEQTQSQSLSHQRSLPLSLSTTTTTPSTPS